MENVKVIKKTGIAVPFNPEKIKIAITKSADRVLVKLTEDDYNNVINNVIVSINSHNLDTVSVDKMHSFVEYALHVSGLDSVADSYRSYRNWKSEMAYMMDDTYLEFNKIYNSDGDHENANAEETLVTTKRCKVASYLEGHFYKKFFLKPEEVKAIVDGYFYIHDRNARLDSYNCCLFDVESVMTGGFDFGPSQYTEPKDLDTAMNLLADIISMSAGNQYGGWTTQIDSLLAPYVKKSYDHLVQKYTEKYLKSHHLTEPTDEIKSLAHSDAIEDIEEILRQRFQGLEMSLNTVASSRGDFPFTTFCFGIDTSWEGKLVSEWCMKVRMKGQGRDHKTPMVFPKLVFMYDENLHGEGKPMEDLFDLAIECSSSGAMYPDYLSLTGDGYVAEMYKKYKKPIIPMGCRAYLSAWYERGGRKPADDKDVPVFMGRFNLGAISLNLPMIYQRAKVDGIDFYELLDKYLEMIRSIHLRTIEYLGKKKASMSPLAFCEGGLYGGHLKPNECIAPVLKSCTISYGITALNELQVLYNGKTLHEDQEFVNEVIDHINEYRERISEEDDVLYALYSTPAESLCGTQLRQFRDMFGIIPGVSDKNYFTNGFHVPVYEDITGIEKQNDEYKLFHKINGGHIQYVRYDNTYNKKAFKDTIRRAMDMGFYEGVNLHMSYCEDCGTKFLDRSQCPHCGSKNLRTIDRVCGYLGYTVVNGITRMNKAKLAEIADRKSM